MVQTFHALSEIFPPATVAQLEAMIAQTPPPNGALVELSPDRRRITWTDVHGVPWAIDITPPMSGADDEHAA